MILTPGAKTRLLRQVQVLQAAIRQNRDREYIMWSAAELMPTVVAEFNYSDPPKSRTRKKTLEDVRDTQKIDVSHRYRDSSTENY